MYQRGRIQAESLLYEHKKHSGELPIVGINTFLSEGDSGASADAPVDLMRSSDQEKQHQLESLRLFQKRHAKECQRDLKQLQEVAMRQGNVFGELLETVKTCSLGQITDALFEVGGEYRRNM